MNDESISEERLYREFADTFRSSFKPFEKKWPNIRVDFGPLALMEGWVKFLEIAFIIDDLLAHFSHSGNNRE